MGDCGYLFPLGLLAKLTDTLNGTWFADSTVTGVILPLLVIAVMVFISKTDAPGWGAIKKLTERESGKEAPQSSAFPALIVSFSLLLCACTLLGMIPLNEMNRGMLAGFGVALFAFSVALYAVSKRMKKAERDL